MLEWSDRHQDTLARCVTGPDKIVMSCYLRHVDNRLEFTDGVVAAWDWPALHSHNTCFDSCIVNHSVDNCRQPSQTDESTALTRDIAERHWHHRRELNEQHVQEKFLCS